MRRRRHERARASAPVVAPAPDAALRLAEDDCDLGELLLGDGERVGQHVPEEALRAGRGGEGALARVIGE